MGYIILIVISVSAWFTHLYVCFTDDRWGFLIAGALMFPIAIFHGIGIWFGIWRKIKNTLWSVDIKNI